MKIHVDSFVGKNRASVRLNTRVGTVVGEIHKRQSRHNFGGNWQYYYFLPNERGVELGLPRTDWTEYLATVKATLVKALASARA